MSNDSTEPSAATQSDSTHASESPDQAKLSEAIKQFDQAIAANKDDYEAYYNLGVALKDQEKYDEAIAKFTEATRINDKFSLGYMLWADTLQLQGKLDESFPQYELAIAADDRNYTAFYNWALALKKAQKYPEAIEKLTRVIAINDKYTTAYNLWGDTLMAQEKYEEAAAKYKQSAQTDDTPYVAYYGWATALEKLNQPAEAIEKLEKSIQINDKYAAAYNLWGNLLFAKLDCDGANLKYELATKCDPNFSTAYYNWGLVLTRQKHDEAAIEKFELAGKLDGKNADLHRAWGLSLLNLKRYDEATAEFDLAAKLREKNTDAYNDWGNTLLGQKKYVEAIEKYKVVLSYDESYFHAYRNWGLALAGLKQYEAAIEKYRQSIQLIRKFGKAPDKIWLTYAQNNIAEVIWRQGKYKESRAEWEKTKLAYVEGSEAARAERDAEYFLNFGSMLQNALIDLDGAEAAYNEGLKFDPDNAGILSNLVGLYLEKKDTQVNTVPGALTKLLKADGAATDSASTNYFWKAREYFLKARDILKARIDDGEIDDVYLRLGQLSLALGPNLTTEQYEEAERDLLTALAKDTDQQSSEIRANLGVLYARMENYSKAVIYLSDATKLDSDDLTIRSSLAEAYLKNGSTERAETEYKKILSITPNHVESHIGLAEVYKTMGDADDDPDMYYRAIQKFNEGMRIARSDSGSKKLIGKSLAAAYYSRGYARVKLFESSRMARDERLLNKARRDFHRSKSSDPENYKAARALEKIGKRFGFRASQRTIEKIGPWLLFLLSLGVFTLAQVSILRNRPIANLPVGYYVLMTFGSLIWMVASIYLPQLLKLKVAGIELEKSAVEQITTPTSLEIGS